MIKNILSVVFLLVTTMAICSQECLSGFVMNAEFESYPEVKLQLDKDLNSKWITLQKKEVDQHGFFSFNCPDQKSGRYRILFQQKKEDSLILQEGGIKDCLTPIFILSNEADLDLSKDSCASTNLDNNNQAFQEWKRFRDYQIRNQFNKEEPGHRINVRNFLRDSLQILLVKLFGTKTLNQQQLLSSDIKENFGYYQDLLEELRISDLDPAYYYFLEAKVIAIENETLKSQYRFSYSINILLFLVLVGCLIYIFRILPGSKNKSKTNLSIQEKKIKSLILEGKTNKEIGAELYISVSTVKTHISNIYQKLGVKSRKELVNL